MATTTPNYGLRKPTNADQVNVALDIAGNMDLLDAHGHSGTYERIYNPEGYGVSAGGTAAANSAALATCIAAAEAANGEVRFTGRGPYNLSSQITLDVSKIRISGVGTKLTWGSSWSGTGATGAAIHVINSDNTYSGRRYVHREPQLEGIIVSGGGQGSVASGDGFCIGDDTYTIEALFTVANCVVEGFTNLIAWRSNGWRVATKDSEFRWGKIDVPTGLTNVAENNAFVNCIFADSGGLESLIGSAEWQFTDCSFDNFPVRQNGPSTVSARGTHFENPGSTRTDWHCWYVDDAAASADFAQTIIIFNDPGAAVTVPLFKVHDSNTTYGLTIEGITLALQSETVYNPTLGSELALVLVGGKGRCAVTGWKTVNNSQWIAVGRGQLGGVTNYDGASSFTGWETGGRGTVTLQSGTVKAGAQAFQLSGPAGNNPELFQYFPCSPGQLFMGGLWIKTDFASGTGDVHVQVEWYDRRGFLRSTTSFQTVTSTQDWAWKRVGAYAPDGTAFARLVVGTSTTSGTVVGYVDTILFGSVSRGHPRGGFAPAGPSVAGYVARTASRVNENQARTAWFTGSAASTETLTGASGNGYRKEFVNNGSVPWTIAAGSGDTINGASTLTIYPGEIATLIDSASATWVAVKTPAAQRDVVVVKSADESVAASTTLQNDDHLTLAVVAGEQWILEFTLFVDSTSATPDIKYNLSVPASTTGIMGTIALAAAGTSASEGSGKFGGNTSFTSLASGTLNTGITPVYFRAVLTITTTGSVVLQWAQNTSDPSNVTLKAGSYLRARKVAG